MSKPEDLEKSRDKVIPNWFGPFVDLIEDIVFLGRLENLWNRLLEKAELAPGEKVIDVGCGSGQVTVWALEKVTDQGEVIGIDASEKMIQLSRLRAEKMGAEVEFRVAVMEDLPFDDDTFDAVLSSQALHHVPRDAKMQALLEMKRILKPGGRLLLCDHGKPYSIFLKILFFPFRWNIFEFQAENIRGQIPGMISETFGNVQEADRFFGWMRIWKAIKS